ncbi:hypothetical protein SAMN04487965_3120 [Microbulbifer donghaiensis]|uniref:Uncharacterized protein n=1 Tax=Microbulbifer donghaiensis TaxID=494016 RepID=A0A1M5G8M2_9GAMM|nr:hypothetical protein [Microbulbifer donghaiensis]SHG00170.1 hypothetical protein SAMN04487965_3120 [Microbulbifer donghaiensis]
MSVWERQYRDAAAGLTSPAALDDKILQQAQQLKPPLSENRWLSKAASSCAAVTVLVLLMHPAQYLGALTPGLQPAHGAQNNPLRNWQHKPSQPTPGNDPWFHLRSQVNAGSYIELCNQWRKQQQGSTSEKLPRDLESKARTHCRLLP